MKKHSIDMAKTIFEAIEKDRERISKFLPWPQKIRTLQDEIDFLNKSINLIENYEQSGFSILQKSDQSYVGNISGFKFDWVNSCCEIGYWLGENFEGKGYMNEAFKLLEREIFKVGFNRITVLCSPDNIRSNAVVKKLSYTYEGTMRAASKLNGKFINLNLYSKLRSEYI